MLIPLPLSAWCPHGGRTLLTRDLSQLSVVPAKYQSNLFGSDDSSESPLRQYQQILQDYIDNSPDEGQEDTGRTHGLYREPYSDEYDSADKCSCPPLLPAWIAAQIAHVSSLSCVLSVDLAQCNNGECPTDLLTERILPGDVDYGSHPDEETVALFRYNASYVTEDRRVSYYSDDYPWLRMAAKLKNPANLHSDYDMIKVAINNTLFDDGQVSIPPSRSIHAHWASFLIP